MVHKWVKKESGEMNASKKKEKRKKPIQLRTVSLQGGLVADCS